MLRPEILSQGVRYGTEISRFSGLFAATVSPWGAPIAWLSSLNKKRIFGRVR
jgi:hypothetical protein